MRPHGKGPLESLYFHYPLFAAKSVPELAGAATTHPVVIVGAGPIGMTAALHLAKYGIASVILEQNNTFNDGSRAICVSRSSFHILERAGALTPFLEKSLGWTTGRSFYRGEQILEFDMPHSDEEKYLPMYNLQQQYTERFLYDAVARTPLIDLRWCSQAIALQDQGDQVMLQVSSPEGNYALTARHLLAADGARSAIRRMCGLRLNGDNYEGRYVIADLRMEHDYPTERRALFEPASNPGGTVLIHKQPDNIWRVDYQLAPGEVEEEALNEENLIARVSSILADIGHDGPWELEWWSIYSANTLCLDDYRHKRVTFIGDSAHVVPIFGVRGLNNGLADAENIAWKLARVLSGQATEKLLDSYSPERRGATLDTFQNASKSARFMTPPTRGYRLMRSAALSLSLRHDFARVLANPRNMTPYSYRDSPLTPYPDGDKDFECGPPSGAACQNARLDTGDYVLDHAGPGYTGLAFVDDTATGLSTLNQTLAKQDPLYRCVTIGASETADIHDSNGRIAASFGAVAGSFYLLRPDLHVAGRWKELAAGEIETCITLGNGGQVA